MPGCHPIAVNGVVFLGEVLGVRKLNKPTDSPGVPYLSRAYRFRVVETFVGSQRNGEEVEVRTGRGGGDCGYTFSVGQQYLVDAYAPQNGVDLSTGIYSATAPENLAQIALTELRTRATGRRVPDLNGQVLTVEGTDWSKPGESKPFPGVRVAVTGQADGASFTVVTDDAGMYSLPILPPGTYRVSFGLSPTRAAWEEEEDKPTLITIPANDGTGASCHLNIHAAPAGTITGQIVDATGSGLKGFVAAYPATQVESRNWAASASTDESGRFKLNFLRDGSYRLVFSTETAPLKRFTSQAVVQNGQATADLHLLIP